MEKHILTTLICLAIVALGLGLRAVASGGELWFDEIWSLVLLRRVHSIAGIFLELRHDNNHPLNSVWLYLLGEGRSSWMYRAPALLSSSVLLSVICWHAIRDRSATLVFWLLFCSVSYFGVLYGSEARGYSSALACAVIGYFLLPQGAAPQAKNRTYGFLAVSAIGILSHAVYALFLGPVVAWLWFLRTRARPLRVPLSVVRIMSAGSIAIIAVSFLGFYSRMEIGGGPLLPYLQVAGSTLSVAFGGSELSLHDVERSAWMLFGTAGILTIVVLELILWIRERDPRAVLVSFIIAAGPLSVAVAQPSFILGRYFIIQIVFAYLVAARFLVRMSRRSSFGAVITGVLVVGFAVGNLINLHPLLSGGRAHYNEAFETMVSSSPSPTVTVGGNQDFQNSVRLAYSKRVYPKFDKLLYVNGFLRSETSPDYLIWETIDHSEHPAETLIDARGTLYLPFKQYDAPYQSGSLWVVYRRSDSE